MLSFLSLTYKTFTVATVKQLVVLVLSPAAALALPLVPALPPALDHISQVCLTKKHRNKDPQAFTFILKKKKNLCFDFYTHWDSVGRPGGGTFSDASTSGSAASGDGFVGTPLSSDSDSSTSTHSKWGLEISWNIHTHSVSSIFNSISCQIRDFLKCELRLNISTIVNGRSLVHFGDLSLPQCPYMKS